MKQSKQTTTKDPRIGPRDPNRDMTTTKLVAVKVGKTKKKTKKSK